MLVRLRPVVHFTSSRDVGNTAWAYAKTHLLDIDFLPAAERLFDYCNEVWVPCKALECIECPRQVLLKSYQNFCPGDPVAQPHLASFKQSRVVRAKVALANLLWAAAVGTVPPEVLRAALEKGVMTQAMNQLRNAELARSLWALGQDG